jgi:hypothetical protein
MTRVCVLYAVFLTFVVLMGIRANEMPPCPDGYYDACGICGGDGTTCSWYGSSVVGLVQTEKLKCSGIIVNNNQMCISVDDTYSKTLIASPKLRCNDDPSIDIPLVSSSDVGDMFDNLYTLCMPIPSIAVCDSTASDANDTINLVVDVDHYRDLSSTAPSGSGSSMTQLVSHQTCNLHATYTKDGTTTTQYHSLNVQVNAKIVSHYWSEDKLWVYSIIRTSVRRPDIACNDIALRFSSVSAGSGVFDEGDFMPPCLDPQGRGLIEPSSTATASGICHQFWRIKMPTNGTCVNDRSVLNFTTHYPDFQPLHERPVSVDIRTYLCNDASNGGPIIGGTLRLKGSLRTFSDKSLTSPRTRYTVGQRLFAYFTITNETLPPSVCNMFNAYPFHIALCKWVGSHCAPVAVLYDGHSDPPLYRLDTVISKNYPEAASNPLSALRRNADRSKLCVESGFVFDFVAPPTDTRYRHSIVAHWMARKNRPHSYLNEESLFGQTDDLIAMSSDEGDDDNDEKTAVVASDEKEKVDGERRVGPQYLVSKSSISASMFSRGLRFHDTHSSDISITCPDNLHYNPIDNTCSEYFIDHIVKKSLFATINGIVSLVLVVSAGLVLFCLSAPAATKRKKNTE